MSASQRNKGARGELEVVELVRAAGWPRAHRNYDQPAEGGSDIVGGPEGVCIEIKRRAKRVDVPGAMRQAEAAAGPLEIPLVLHRVDRGAWQATLPLDELLGLLAWREQA